MIFLNVSVIAWYSDKRHPPCSKCSVAVKFSHHQLTYTIWDILPWKCENQISWPCYTFLFRLYLKQRSYSDRFNFRSISIFLLILSCLLWMMLLGPPPTTFPAPTGPMEHVSGMSMGTLTLPPPMNTEHDLLCFIKWEKWEIAFLAGKGLHSTNTAFLLFVLSRQFLTCTWLLLIQM